MTEEEKILKKAIIHARAKGFDLHAFMTKHYPFINPDIVMSRLRYFIDNNYYYALLFNHDFALKLYGKDPVCLLCGKSDFDAGKSFDGEVTEYNPHCKNCGVEMIDQAEFGRNDGTTLPAYLYHLSESVQWQKPILYIEKYFTDNNI